MNFKLLERCFLGQTREFELDNSTGEVQIIAKDENACGRSYENYYLIKNLKKKRAKKFINQVKRDKKTHY